MANLVVGSKVKEAIKAKGCHTSGELIDALDQKVASLLNDACERTQANKRSTVKPQDL
ncbi:MAG: hypothetical protein U5L76_01005 [Patescibacteria group bacterium]|nr:hypothetical protein [Patescibacteria group bacterium]